jgi:hypothetical protein
MHSRIIALVFKESGDADKLKYARFAYLWSSSALDKFK